MNEAAFHIRPAGPADLDLIQSFIRDLAIYERLENDCTGSRETLNAGLFGPTPFAHVLLAFEGNEPAGFAVYFFTFSTFAARPVLYLEDLFVKPSMRGKGIGTELFNALLRIAHAQHSARMEWSVLNWNETAVRFYEQLGAKAQPDWTCYQMTSQQITAHLKAATAASSE